MNKKILIVGFGTVGRGFYELFQWKKASGRLPYKDDIEISEIVDAKFGHLRDFSQNQIENLKAGEGLQSSEVVEIIRQSDVDIVCEFTWVDIKNNAEPAFTHMMEALRNGKHVITTNKGPIALRYQELMDFANTRKLRVKFKGTVMAGTPSYNLLGLLPGIKVNKIRGILNGTTNYILTEIENGKSFEESLNLAQAKGYAEADPTMDVDGFDSALKTIIISNVLGWFGKEHTLSEMEIEGIRNLRATPDGSVTKLIVEADESHASVKPTIVKKTDILAKIGGVLNALELETDTLGTIVSIGPGAGKIQTAQAVLTDLGEILA